MIRRILPVLLLVCSFTTVALKAAAESPLDAAALSKAVGLKRLELASLLIKSLDAGLVCDTDAHPSEIVRTVSSAMTFLDESEINAWLATVPADSKMRADFAFRERTTFDKPWGSYVTKADMEKKLLGTKFHRLGAGVYGSTWKVILNAGGVAAITYLEELDAEPYFTWTNRSGTWDVDVVQEKYSQEVIVKIDNEKFRIEWQEDEAFLVPMDLPNEQKQQNTLSSSDSYCEA